MRNVRSRSCENLSVVISVVRHSPCEGYWNARMTWSLTKSHLTGHLQSCYLSKLVGNVEEHDLILMRAGKFDLPTHQQECMWICPNHRYNLGRNWHPLKTCQYPLHSGARKKLKNKDVVNLQRSKNIQTIFGVTIPIGSGKRVSFNNYKCQQCLKYK